MRLEVEEKYITELKDNLKNAREMKNLTQEDLARKAYLTKNIISNIERGITQNVKPKDLKLLAYALNVTEDFLIGKAIAENKNAKGFIEPISVLPEWNWRMEIPEVLKKHIEDRSVEILIRDFVFFIGQMESEPTLHTKPEIQIFKNILKLLGSDKFKDKSFLNDFLELLIKKSNIKEEF